MKIVNKKKFVKSISILIVSIVAFISIIWATVDFIEYPEKYLTTWRYQLHNKVNAGDQEAIDYYQHTYLDHNITLWN